MSNKHEQADARLEHLLRHWGADQQAARPVASSAPAVRSQPLRPERWLWRLAPVAVAACLLIGFGLGRLVIPHSTPQPQDRDLASMETQARRSMADGRVADGARREPSMFEADSGSGADDSYIGQPATSVTAPVREGEVGGVDYYADRSSGEAVDTVWREVDDGLLDLRMQRTIVSRSDQNALQVANRYLQRRLVETEEALTQTNIELAQFKGQVDTLNEQVDKLEAEVATQVLALAEAPQPVERVSTGDDGGYHDLEREGGVEADMPAPESVYDVDMDSSTGLRQYQGADVTTNVVMIAGYEAEQEVLRKEVEESRRREAQLAVSVTQLANRMADPAARTLKECQSLLSTQELMIQVEEFAQADDLPTTIDTLLGTCQVLLLRLSMLEDTPEAVAGFQALLDELGVLPKLAAATRREDLSPELLACLAQIRLLLTEVRALD